VLVSHFFGSNAISSSYAGGEAFGTSFSFATASAISAVDFLPAPD
jgi:hypothetical protein